jgi:hypothetical protein
MSNSLRVEVGYNFPRLPCTAVKQTVRECCTHSMISPDDVQSQSVISVKEVVDDEEEGGTSPGGSYASATSIDPLGVLRGSSSSPGQRACRYTNDAAALSNRRS